MISVVIMINGYPIMARSAFRLTEYSDDKPNEYQVDTGDILIHTPNEGAIPLCKAMLDTIEEAEVQKR